MPDLRIQQELNEKTLKAEQYKVLDVARPLLFLREQMSQDDSFRDSEMSKAVDTALRLWGHTFHGITTIRRENLLKVSDPKFVSLLKEPERFQPRQCSSLFGKAFIKEMVKEAKDDQQLKIISRGNGNSSATKPRSSGHRVTIEVRRGTIAEAAATTTVGPAVAISTKKASTAVSTRVDQLAVVVSTAIGTSSILLLL